MNTILISGAGQLGSRYLQGLAGCNTPLQIWVQDIQPVSLLRAEKRWNDAVPKDSVHEIFFHSSYASIPTQIDIAILATTADVRPQAVAAISQHAAVKYWVLEKVLAQSGDALDEILAGVAGCSGAWVNSGYRMTSWHKQIKSQLGLRPPVTLNYHGEGWGLACNSVHFLDLLAWWTGETLQNVRLVKLERQWVESKRPGFSEIRERCRPNFPGVLERC